MRSRRAPVIALIVLALLLAGCANVASPEGWSPPTLEEDGALLFVSMNDGEISALNADDYSLLWEFPEDDEFACGGEEAEARDLEGIYGSPAVGEDLVYVGAYDGNVYALSKEEGVCQWSFEEPDDPIVGSLVLHEGALYVPSTDGHLYVLDPDTGAETQRVDAGDIWSTPTLGEDGDLYITTMDGEIQRLSGDTLERVWQFDAGAGLITTPTFAGDTVLAGGIGAKLYGVDSETGEESWSFADADNWYWGRPLIDGDRAYATNLDGKVYALDAGTGEVVWSFDTEAAIRSAAASFENMIVVVNKEGDIFALDAGSGDLLWGPTELEQTVYADPLAVEDGVLIISRRGNLFLVNEEGVPTEVAD